MTQTLPAQTRRPGIHVPGEMPSRMSIIRSTLFRSSGIFGKDLARYAPVPLIIAGVALILEGAPKLMQVFYPHRLGTNLRDLGLQIFLIFLPVTAYSVGLAVGGDEEDSKTRLFLDQLPGSRLHYVLGKLAAGLLLILFWSLLTVFVVGPLSGYGLQVFQQLLGGLRGDHVPSGPFGYFSVGYVLANAAIFFAGAAAGAVFRSVVIAAFGGAGMLLAYVFVAFGITHVVWDSANTRPEGIYWLIFVIFGLWCLIMTLTMISRYRFAREDSQRTELTEATEAMVEQVRGVRHRAGFDPPWSHPMRLPLILMGAMCLFGPWLLGPRVLPMWLVMVVPAGMLLGIASWVPEERDGTRWFLYVLPVSRGVIYWQRIASLLGRMLLLFGAAAIGLLFGATREPVQGANSLLAAGQGQFWCLLLTIALTAISCALCGNLFALFHRLKIAAGFLAMVVGITWGMCANEALWKATFLPGGDAGGFWIYAGWIAVVMLLIPIAVGYLAFCRSPLLEQSEERRGAIAVPVVLLMLIWGCLLVTMSPPQLAMILWG
jgi:ABC-type transport system involved in multi-copper enzyme maturation permease subunit